MSHLSAGSLFYFHPLVDTHTLYLHCNMVSSVTVAEIVLLEAVHRYYESRRRLFNDHQPGHCEKAKEIKERCRKINFQKKVSAA